MKSTIFIIYLFFASIGMLKAQIVQDPVKDFLTRMSRKANDELFKVSVRVNRKGGNEVFLIYSSMANGRAGYVWVVYAPVDGGYQCLDDLITFKPRPLSFGNFKELGGLGMLTYAPDAGGKGSLVGYIFDGMNIRETNLGMIEFNGKDKALTDKYFTEDRRPAVEVTTADKLPKTSNNSQ